MKNTKKGFSLVELVIVIAVIAILAAVLIPTFTFVLDNAKQAKALNDYKTSLDSSYIECVSAGTVPTKLYVKGNRCSFTSIDGATEYSLADDGYLELDNSYNIYFIWENDSYKVVTSDTTPSGSVLPPVNS